MNLRHPPTGTEVRNLDPAADADRIRKYLKKGYVEFEIPVVEPTAEELRAAMPELDYAVFWVMLCRTPWNGVSFEQHVLDIYAAMPDGQDKRELYYWINNSKFRRTHPVLVGMAQSMGVTPEQVDAMWAAALSGI